MIYMHAIVDLNIRNWNAPHVPRSGYPPEAYVRVSLYRTCPWNPLTSEGVSSQLSGHVRRHLCKRGNRDIHAKRSIARNLVRLHASCGLKSSLWRVESPGRVRARNGPTCPVSKGHFIASWGSDHCDRAISLAGMAHAQIIKQNIIRCSFCFWD